MPDQFNALLDTKRLDELLGAREMGRRLSLREQQLAFVHGDSQHICVIVRGTTRWVPIAPFAVPDFADLARVMVAKAA